MEVLTAYFIVFAVLFIFQCITLILVLQMRNKPHVSEGGMFRESQAKTHSIIYKAIQQANKILVAAELKGLQLVSKEKVTGGELSDHFKEHLDTIEKALENQLERNAKHAEDAYGTFIRTAQESIAGHIHTNQAMLEQKAQAMIERTETLLTRFTVDMEKKVKDDVEKQLAAAAAEIDQYKATRMRVIDERIIDVLESVIRVALDKKMSLADQSELIYKALEDAKKEHAFDAKSNN